VRLGFPNVIFADPTPESWAECLTIAASIKWDPAWDALPLDYDWHKLAEQFSTIIEATPPGPWRPQ